MGTKNQRGVVNVVAMLLGVCLLFLVGSLIFGIWSYTQMQDYKKNTQQKIDTAVAVAVTQAETRKDNEFVEKEKNPLKQYISPAAYGAVNISYPKTWAAYIIESNQGSNPINGYFHPIFVPNTQDEKNAYALRVEVVQQQYNQVVKSFESQIKNGKIKSSAYQVPKVTTASGIKLDGQISSNKNGVMVVLPMRDKTIKIYTESVDFRKDFEEIILKNLTFSP